MTLRKVIYMPMSKGASKVMTVTLKPVKGHKHSVEIGDHKSSKILVNM